MSILLIQNQGFRKSIHSIAVQHIPYPNIFNIVKNQFHRLPDNKGTYLTYATPESDFTSPKGDELKSILLHNNPNNKKSKNN